MLIKNLLIVLSILIAGLLFFFYKQPVKEKGESSLKSRTEVIIYTPKLGNYPQKVGECWSASTALQGRDGSLRCAVGEYIIDPCFKIDDKIICDTNPLEGGDEFELILEEGDEFGVLDDNDDTKDTVKTDKNKRFSWIYQLEDGSYCFLIQGTAGSIDIGGSYYYVCDENKVIIGDVDKSSDLWKAEVGYLAEGSYNELKKRETQSVVKAWD